MTGELPSYPEQLKGRLQCRECGEEMVAGIFGGAQDDTAWVIGIGDTELENLGHGGRAVDVSYVLPGQGISAELPSSLWTRSEERP